MTALFLETPHHIISYIYQSIGCQHCLLPTANNFLPPSIPALTVAGFVRWEAIQILLGPEEHVPFIQAALHDFGIKHPDTGEPFPVEIPREAFPLHSDAQIEKWHRMCGEKLLRGAPPDGDGVSSPRSSFSRPKERSGYSHIRAQYTHIPRDRQFAEYYASKPISNIRTSTRATRPPLSTRPTRASRRASDVGDFPDTPRGRRMSVPENLYMNSPNIPPAQPVPQPGLRLPKEGRSRRHSHPRVHGRHNSSSSSSDTDTQPTSDASLSPGLSPRRTSQAPFSGSKRTSFSAPSPTSPLNPPLSTRHRGRSAPQFVPDPPVVDYQIPINVSSPLPTPLMPSSRLSAQFPSDFQSNNTRWRDGGDDGKEKFNVKYSSDWEHERLRRGSQDNYVHSKLSQPRSGSHDSRTRNKARSSRERDVGEDLELERRPRRYYGELGIEVDGREEMFRR